MFTFLIFALLAFAIYLYFQSKVKNHSNYPVVYAMLLGFLVYASGSSLPQWIIDNLNAHTTLALTPYEPLSGYKMLGFGVFLIVLVALYVMKKQAFRAVYLFAFIGLLFVFFLKESNSQENNFWAFFNFGNVNQSIGGDATMENQEEIQRQLEIVIQQRGNSALSTEEKRRLENEILSLRQNLIDYVRVDNGVILGSSDNGESFKKINSYSTPWLSSITTLDSKTLIVVGKNGIILKSIDAGESFKKITSPVNSWLSSIIALNKKTLIIVGSRGVILKSTDEGESFKKILSHSSSYLESITMLDNKSLIVVGSKGVILKSTDFGEHFKKINSFSTSWFKSIGSSDNKRVIIVGSNPR